MLQTAAVSAEALGLLPGSIERGLRERLLPPLELLSKQVGGKARDPPQVSRSAGAPRRASVIGGFWFCSDLHAYSKVGSGVFHRDP
jgi:hypothetical protein